MSRALPEDSLKAHLAEMQSIIERLEDNMNRLLLMVAERKSKCTACSQYIWWVRTRLGKMAPFDTDGVSHFATCPFADRFRKQQKEQQNGRSE